MRFVERDDATIDPEIMGKSRFSSSVTTKMANSFLRGKGILLRTRVERVFLRRYDQNGRDYMPASFLHASMQAPNCISRQERPFVRARVAFLIGSKFEPHSLKSNLQDKVDCRAYYPLDAWSAMRDHAFLDNIWGTSCYKVQLDAEFAAELYNVTNRYVDTGELLLFMHSFLLVDVGSNP